VTINISNFNESPPCKYLNTLPAPTFIPADTKSSNRYMH